jgi:uncharacterized Ntn-hydrolase superfamily protein
MTYSIVARDPETGRFGVAVQSHWFAVGRIVPWAEAGVGAVATQSFAEASYGPLALDLMRRGKSAREAMDALLLVDDEREARQVAIVDAAGDVATHTGEDCLSLAGHRAGDGYSVQANIMERDSVWPAMAQAFEGTGGDLPDRLFAALRAAQAEGGDLRGMQSAAILIVEAAPTGREWVDRVLDLRVEDHDAPLDELERLIRRWRAYGHAERAEDAELAGDADRALVQRLTALEIEPDNPEMAFWAAVSLADAGRIEEARAALRPVRPVGDRWAELLRRCIAEGALELDAGTAEMLTAELEGRS